MHAAGQRSSLGGGGELPSDMWRRRRQEVAWGWPSTATVALHSGGAEEQRREAGWRWKKGLNCNFQNFQGQNCKQAITFKLGLK